MKQTAKDKIIATIKGNASRGYKTSCECLHAVRAEHPMTYDQAIKELLKAGEIVQKDGGLIVDYCIP